MGGNTTAPTSATSLSLARFFVAREANPDGRLENETRHPRLFTRNEIIKSHHSQQAHQLGRWVGKYNARRSTFDGTAKKTDRHRTSPKHLVRSKQKTRDKKQLSPKSMSERISTKEKDCAVNTSAMAVLIRRPMLCPTITWQQETRTRAHTHTHTHTQDRERGG